MIHKTISKSEYLYSFWNTWDLWSIWHEKPFFTQNDFSLWLHQLNTFLSFVWNFTIQNEFLKFLLVPNNLSSLITMQKKL